MFAIDLIRINAAAQPLGDPARNQGSPVAHSKTTSPAEPPPGFAARAMPPGDGRLVYSESAFLAMLGDRVRGMRILREMSRRELARRSRVSERYIAQIEAGKGIVSIVLLLRIARAIRVGPDADA
jgi:DNA-binding XRE family transcriptional regulator